MENHIYLSLCIPTNGVIEWVVPVIDSIYKNHNDIKEFEVIVTDNGSNVDFEKIMNEYQNKYSNLIYKKTTAVMFMNQIESFNCANGDFIKFINHRMALDDDAVDYLIDFVKKNIDDKPVTYFSNGVLKLNSKVKVLHSFDDYVGTLSYWSSWSGGVGLWKEDFDSMDKNYEFNSLFPHTDVIFCKKNAKNYIIDDTKLLTGLNSSEMKKGKYNLFQAFAVEYPRIIEKLYKDGFIRESTFNSVIKDNKCFVGKLYYDYIIKKKPCSYDLSGFNDAMGRYYNKIGIFSQVLNIYFVKLKNICKKLLN